MNDQARMPKRGSAFAIGSSNFIRHSEFAIRHLPTALYHR
jgi:hypothetical protein